MWATLTKGRFRSVRISADLRDAVLPCRERVPSRSTRTKDETSNHDLTLAIFLHLKNLRILATKRCKSTMFNYRKGFPDMTQPDSNRRMRRSGLHLAPSRRTVAMLTPWSWRG